MTEPVPSICPPRPDPGPASAASPARRAAHTGHRGAAAPPARDPRFPAGDGLRPAGRPELRGGARLSGRRGLRAPAGGGDRSGGGRSAASRSNCASLPPAPPLRAPARQPGAARPRWTPECPGPLGVPAMEVRADRAQRLHPSRSAVPPPPPPEIRSATTSGSYRLRQTRRRPVGCPSV
ncbi:basic proline-rich protein-like [Mesocricetus auratus]|uniref:Basic proline-rich protein-like n=1 Tax=Mesocricetus auratus TaxID=10036 RepID=A0ABM2X0J2_MESAU|nr:basic proline-rich protein-like [Mesocricetus auratus]